MGLVRCKGTSFQVTLVLSQPVFVPEGLARSVRPGCCWVIAACAQVVLLLQDAAVYRELRKSKKKKNRP